MKNAWNSWKQRRWWSAGNEGVCTNIMLSFRVEEEVWYYFVKVEETGRDSKFPMEYLSGSVQIDTDDCRIPKKTPISRYKVEVVLTLKQTPISRSAFVLRGIL